MTNGVEGHIFEGVKTTSNQFSRITNNLANNRSFVIKGYDNELNVSVSGLNVTVDTGWAIIQGRYVYLNQKQTLVAQANWSGYIVLEIDLSKTNTPSGDPSSSEYILINNQVDLKLVSNPIKGNLLGNDTLTHFELAKITTSGTTASLEIVGKNINERKIEVDIGFGTKLILEKRGNIVTASLPRQIVNINVKADNGILPEVKNYQSDFYPKNEVSLVYSSNFGQSSTNSGALRFNDKGDIFLTNTTTGSQTIQGDVMWFI